MPATDSRNMLSKMEARFEEGTWVGATSGSGEAMILTEDGLKCARTIRRVEDKRKYDQEHIKNVKATQSAGNFEEAAPW